jgi:hypothetical protein
MNLRVTFAHAGWATVLAAAVVVCSARPVAAQSLGAVAKESEAQRKVAKSSGKVYTNDSLKSAPAPSPTAAAATPATSTAEQAPTADAKPKADAGKDEATWRERIKSERDGLTRSEAFAAALQSQINGLYAEFTACQAPTQCKDVSEKRQKSIAELDRVKKEIAAHTKAITDIQDEARKAGVPAGWVR